MTAEPPQSPVAGAVRSLEVRWIFPGPLEAAVARWFARFPATAESRVDAYLLDPPLPGLSVKIRGGGALEVKAYRGSPGILEVPGRARGRMEAWLKWSFPVSPLGPGAGGPPGWRRVGKRRRIGRLPPARTSPGPTRSGWAGLREGTLIPEERRGIGIPGVAREPGRAQPGAIVQPGLEHDALARSGHTGHDRQRQLRDRVQRRMQTRPRDVPARQRRHQELHRGQRSCSQDPAGCPQQSPSRG